MDAFKALPEPVKTGLIGAGVGGISAAAMGDNESLMSYSISYGALSALSAYVTPMVLSDQMQQLAGVAVVGAGSQFVAPSFVPGSMLMAAGVPAASLWLSRMAS